MATVADKQLFKQYGLLELPDEWVEFLKTQEESGMDYQIVTIILDDGRVFENVAVSGSRATEAIVGVTDFYVETIKQIIVTHGA